MIASLLGPGEELLASLPLATRERGNCRHEGSTLEMQLDNAMVC